MSFHHLEKYLDTIITRVLEGQGQIPKGEKFHQLRSLLKGTVSRLLKFQNCETIAGKERRRNIHIGLNFESDLFHSF